ncbi:hypothetical protein AHAS_Ahas14G0250500 [Arachis hypogaea]
MLPPELITQILLRLSVKHLGCVKSVSKLWNNLISDPNFAKSHFELSLAPSHRCIFIPEVTIDHRSIDLDALSHATDADAAAATITKIPPSDNYSDDDIVLGSCRGFIALYQYPHFFVIWNPLTGSHRIISCHHIAKISDMATNSYYSFGGEVLFGFGYDATRDDYLVVLGWNDKKENKEGHLDFFSLRSNSWSSFIIPDQIKWRKNWTPSVFYNGAIHWLNHDGDYDAIVTILVFDTSKRKGLLEIPVPERVGKDYPCRLTVLGGCLALYYDNDKYDYDYDKCVIWVMKEYNVQSSWTSYEIPSSNFEPVYLSEDGDFIGFDESDGMSKYNVRGELLLRFDRPCDQVGYFSYTVYTESLLILPNDGSEEKEGYVTLSFYALLCGILALLILLYAVMMDEVF